jgi:predicted phage terminase large subunit-like protein
MPTNIIKKREYPELSLYEKIQAEKARRNLYEFVRQAWHVVEPATPYIDGWHIRAVVDHLVAVTNGDIQQLLINVPPRHAKSLIVGVFWPAWSWIDRPDTRWLCSSYAMSLAIRDNRKCRLLIESDWYQQRWSNRFTMASDQNMKGRFENSARGYRLATSVGSAATGEGGDYVLCLAGHTKLVTNEGTYTIQEIVEHRLPVKVLAYEHTTQACVFRPITAYEKNPGRKMLRLYCSRGKTLEVTEDHPIYIKERGYVAAKFLKPYDRLIGCQDQQFTYYYLYAESIETPEYVYNVRVLHEHNYFADGILTHNCDDPHNAQDIYSDVRREEALLWWDTTMSTRLNDPKKGGKVIVMQRLGEKDLSGHVLEQGGYTHVCLPAEFDSERKCFTEIGWSDPRTVDGQLLWPDQVGVKELDKLKKALGSVAYAAQYLQAPTPVGGNIFRQDYFVYFTSHEEYFTLHGHDGDKNVARATCWYFSTVDLAISQKNTADYTVIATWAVTPENDLLLVELIRDRFTGPEIQQQIAWCYQRWNQSFIEIEAVAFQLSLAQTMSISYGVPVRPVTPHKDKVSRAISASVFYSNGQIYHEQFADYLLEFEKELLNFPNGAHDDTVDTVSMAAAALFNPNTPNLRHLDDEDDVDTEQPIIRQMERGIFDDF